MTPTTPEIILHRSGCLAWLQSADHPQRWQDGDEARCSCGAVLHALRLTLTLCACMECLWLGIAAELRAQTCPRCDGRVADYGSPEFMERLRARLQNAADCPTCGNLCHTRGG